jgi:hypothetical protein
MAHDALSLHQHVLHCRATSRQAARTRREEEERRERDGAREARRRAKYGASSRGTTFAGAQPFVNARPLVYWIACCCTTSWFSFILLRTCLLPPRACNCAVRLQQAGSLSFLQTLARVAAPTFVAITSSLASTTMPYTA